MPSSGGRPKAASALQASTAVTLAALVFALIAAAIAASSPARTFWICDAGNKAILTQSLLHHRFASAHLDYPGRAHDPTLVHFPIDLPFASRAGDQFYSQYPIAFAAIVAPWYALFGPRGFYLVPLLAATAAVWLLGRFAMRAFGSWWAAVVALTAGLATPLVFYAVTFWEHSVTVALALGALLLSAGAPNSPTPGGRRLVLAGALVGLACWFRQELILVAFALAGGQLWAGRSKRAASMLVVGTLAALLPLWIWNSITSGHPLGFHVQNNLAPAAERWQGTGLGLAWMLVSERLVVAYALGVASTREIPLGLVRALPILAVVASALVPERRQGWRMGLVAGGAFIGVVSWAVGTREALASPGPIRQTGWSNGLLHKVPLVALAGLGVRALTSGPKADTWRVAAAGALGFIGAATLFAPRPMVLGFHWGPRLYLPAIPVLAVFAWAGAAHLARGAPARWRWIPWTTLVVLAVLSGASQAHGLWLLHHKKQASERVAQALEAAPETAVVTTSWFLPQEMASLYYSKAFLLATRQDGLEEMMLNLHAGGVHRFLLATHLARPLGERLGPLRLELRESVRSQPVRYMDFDIVTCEFLDEADVAAAHELSGAYLRVGERYLAAGRPALGAERLRAAVVIDPHLGRAYALLARAYTVLGRLADAAWAEEQARELGALPSP